ncbi:serine hydrolase [Streptomyces diastaticus]|uniref:serine hydrolase n=1 Tax=Streptomyces diastaticus TaxID=1956 RepID=UPI0037F449AC
MAEQPEDGRWAGGVSRRRLGTAALALGGAVALVPFPAGPAAAVPAAPGAGARGATTLRRGSARCAGLLAGQLRRLVTDAERFLGPSPTHPWYAGAVLLAGRGGTVALHEPIGHAVRYERYDEVADTGVELPPERQVPMAEDTVFDLASVSKLFTSLLAVRRLERGELELGAPVASYLPRFAGGGKAGVTVVQLLTHTSGFPSWIPLYEEPTHEARLARIWAQELVAGPGTAYLYSDLNLITLQLLLEEVTGTPLDELLREEITGPLGMTRTRYNPPASWRPKIAATEDSRPPWAGLDRGMVHGEVHDENAFAMGGVAGHAGVFSCAWDLAVLGRTLLNGGVYGGRRILREESVELMFRDFTPEFPGDAHGLGFELYQHWYMGAMATPRSAGHTGFTGTSLVLDPSTDSFLVVLGNSVHPVRSWRSGSAPRVAAADRMARAVPVRPRTGRTAWFSQMASDTTAVLALPPLKLSGGGARLRCGLWWDTEPGADPLALEVSADGETWEPLAFTTRRRGGEPSEHPEGTAGGWSGRVWHELEADLDRWRGSRVRLRWRYTTDRLYVGRGVYVDAVRVTEGRRVRFDERRPGDAARIEADGWVRSSD